MNEHTTILLIEDDPAVARSLEEGLRREGYSVHWRSTGGEGLEYARTQHPDLILLDVRLPDGSGFDVCRELRRIGLHMPVIMLTVEREELDKVLGLEMGADDYVTKPFSLRELLSRIRAQLRRAYGEFSQDNPRLQNSGQAIHIHDLVIDPVQGQVTRQGSPLELTPTEYRLLLHLAENRGQALSRGQLIDAVWGYAPDLNSEKTVNVYIRRLREKIEPDPSRPALLLTVPGIGYRLAG